MQHLATVSSSSTCTYKRLALSLACCFDYSFDSERILIRKRSRFIHTTKTIPSIEPASSSSAEQKGHQRKRKTKQKKKPSRFGTISSLPNGSAEPVFGLLNVIIGSAITAFSHGCVSSGTSPLPTVPERKADGLLSGIEIECQPNKTRAPCTLYWQNIRFTAGTDPTVPTICTIRAIDCNFALPFYPPCLLTAGFCRKKWSLFGTTLRVAVCVCAETGSWWKSSDR